jgi:hypothetical protein
VISAFVELFHYDCSTTHRANQPPTEFATLRD